MLVMHPCMSSGTLSLWNRTYRTVKVFFLIYGFKCGSRGCSSRQRQEICALNAISNLSRSFWLRHSTTGRFTDYSKAGTVNGVCKRNTARMCMLSCVCGRVRLEGIEPLLLLYLNLHINLYIFLQGTITSLQNRSSQ